MGNPVATPVKSTFRFALTALASAALIAGASNSAFSFQEDDDDDEPHMKQEEKSKESERAFPSYNVESGELTPGYKLPLRFEQGAERHYKKMPLESGTRAVSVKRVPLKDKDGSPVPLTDANGKVVDGQFVNVIDKRMVGQLAAVLPGKDPSQTPEARIFSVTTKDGKTEHIITYTDQTYGNEFEKGITDKFCSHFEIFPREAMEEAYDPAQFADKRVSVDLWAHNSVLVNTNKKHEGSAKVEGYGFKHTVEALDGRNFAVFCAYDKEVKATLTSEKSKEEL